MKHQGVGKMNKKTGDMQHLRTIKAQIEVEINFLRDVVVEAENAIMIKLHKK